MTQFAYDTSGNLTSITDPLNNVTQIAYNQFGQPIATTDPLTNVTQFQYNYNSQGDLAAIIDPLGNTTNRAYDLVSRLTDQTDPRGQPTRFFYDELNRITQIVDALNRVTAFSYDGNGNLLTVTDARGSTTTHTYDSMDRLATRTDPLNRSESYTYDPNGNLTQFTDRKSQVSNFTYDPLSRRTHSSFADGTSTDFTFDAAGRLIRATDSQTGTIVEDYDILDRLIRETTPQGTISYAYDSLGRRTTMTVDGQPPVAYSYDATSRLRTITQAPLNPVTIDYDALGRRTLLTLPNGVSTEYQYDIASRLTALIYRNALGMVSDLTYQYDAAGNRASVGGSFARTLLPNPVASASYDPGSQQLAFDNKVMTYDANGNLSSITDPSGTISFTWDAQNQLTALSAPGFSGSFAYDALGRRIQKVIGTTTATHQYDGVHIVREILNSTEVTYLRTLTIDEPLVRSDGSTPLAYLADALGSIIALTDPSGAVTANYTYEPFGLTTVGPLDSNNQFQFTGRENDGTGLYAYRARYYNPSLHRFASEDPLLKQEFLRARGPGRITRRPPGLIGFVAANVQNLNAYAYVRNNPVNLRDPFGCDPNEECRIKARRAFETCLLVSGVAIGIAEEIVIVGCLLTGPGLVAPCIVAASIPLEAAAVTAIASCSLGLNNQLQQCSR